MIHVLFHNNMVMVWRDKGEYINSCSFDSRDCLKTLCSISESPEMRIALSNFVKSIILKERHESFIVSRGKENWSTFNSSIKEVITVILKDNCSF